MPTAKLFADLRGRALPDAQSGLLLGHALQVAGEPEAALAAFERTAIAFPRLNAAWQACAALNYQLGFSNAALDSCRRGLELASDDVMVLFNLAVLFEATGNFSQALQCYEQVAVLDPVHSGVSLNRPILLAHLGHVDDALVVVRDAIGRNPISASLHYNHGEILAVAGDYEAALAAFEQAWKLDPFDGRACIAAAIQEAACGRVRAARERLDRAAVDYPKALANFCGPLLSALSLETGVKLEVERISLMVDFARLEVFDWSQRDSFRERYVDLVQNEEKPMDVLDSPFRGFALRLPGTIVHRLAVQVASRTSASLAGVELDKPLARKHDRLRIAYLSGDFRQHATAYLMSRLPGLHDRERFQVFVYSCGPADGSSLRQEIIAGADSFCDVSSFDLPCVAQRIAMDGIDILVDMSGYTRYSRSAALALRPAPVQVSYLAYLQTSGAPWIDYALLDRMVLPDAARDDWSERIAYLPHTLYICDDQENAEMRSLTRADAGLPPNVVVFCCLNAGWKIDPECFSCWMEILQRVPTSVLWLYDDTVRGGENLRRTAVAAGVDPARLFFAPKVPHAEHLARYRCADIFLDTFACNAHTTCIEALAAGLPVITLPGDSVIRRVAASLLKAHGFPELIAASQEMYVAQACRLALDQAWRDDLRRRLAARMNSSLFCTERRVREIERAYETMWTRHTAGLPPVDFDVPPLMRKSEAQVGRPAGEFQRRATLKALINNEGECKS